MFSTKTQKILFVIGVIWIIPITFAHVAEILFHGRSLSHLFNLAAWLALPIIVWHFTGVLRPIINWFKE